MNKIAKTRIMYWLVRNSSKKHTHLYRMMSELHKDNQAYYYVRYRKCGISHRSELTKCLELLGVCSYYVGHNWEIAPRGGMKGNYISVY